jgi:hypothetical protein
LTFRIFFLIFHLFCFDHFFDHPCLLGVGACCPDTISLLMYWFIILMM